MLRSPDLGWKRFALVVTGVATALMTTIYLFILIANPFGIPVLAPKEPRAILDANQRFMYPQLIRASQHDSLVIGTSTSRLLEPRRLDAAFGGRFANLALSDGRAWEQYRIADLMIRVNGVPRRLFIGLDRVWCDATADSDRTTYRGFPEWLYDDNSWNDLLHVFNARSLEISTRRLSHLFGGERARFDRDGFGDFTPGEGAYDLGRAKEHIWQRRDPRVVPQQPAFVVSDREKRVWQFPAMVWLEEILQRVHTKSDVYLVFMPVHIAAQPIPQSKSQARESECKQRVKNLANRYGAHYADYRVWSDITLNDDNWWDPLHWRIEVGRRLIQEIASEPSRR